MSKKIIPILSLLGTSALIVGASIQPAEVKKENFSSNINAFQEDLTKFVSANAELTNNSLKKYTLSLQDNLETEHKIETINTETTDSLSNNTNLNTETNTTNQSVEAVNNDKNTLDELNEITEENSTSNENQNIDHNDISKTETESVEEKNEFTNSISTLYSLSNDIEDSCDDFCELKEEINNAIIETQNLINKVQNNEITLNNQQRLFITEQAQQLKNLGRQLASITTELSFNLSDISKIMTTNNQDIDNLSLKYLVVLDNLINGNEMMQSGLSSLNLINQMFYANSTGAKPNNHGRVLYGFQHNDNPPIIKDYQIDENGNWIENNISNNQSEDNQEKDIESASDKKDTTIDTYKSNIESNLDTYNDSNLNHNIDSFFNTALLDNEFMYGNNGYGNGLQFRANPYAYGYNQNLNNTNHSVANNENTQDIKGNNENKKDKKKFQLKKNIDTFKDENEPDIKTKLNNIKNNITGFFSKFKKSDLNDKISNPVYRYNPNENE